MKLGESVTEQCVKMQVVLTLSISVWRGGDIHSTERGRSSWLFVEFFVLKRAVRPRVRAFWYCSNLSRLTVYFQFRALDPKVQVRCSPFVRPSANKKLRYRRGTARRYASKFVLCSRSMGVRKITRPGGK